MPKKSFFKLFIYTALTTLLLFGVIKTPNGRAQSLDLGIGATGSNPTDFILSWSCNSYVPVDYQGKALPTRGSQITVVAIPTKKLAQNPDGLYYRWLLDDEIAGYANGQGKSSFQFRATKWMGDDHLVELQILDANQKLLARITTSVSIVEPELLLKNPRSNYALQDGIIVETGQNVTISAYPMFFHVKDTSAVDWQWSFDNQTLTPQDQKNLNQLVLKIPSGKLSQSLQKVLSLLATNKSDQYEQTSASLNVEIR